MADVNIPLEIENQRLLAESLAGSAEVALQALVGQTSNYDPKFLQDQNSVAVVPPDTALLDIPPFTPRNTVLPPQPVSGALTQVTVPPLPDLPPDRTGTQPGFTIPPVPAQMASFSGGPAPAINDVGTVANIDIDALLAAIPALELLPITIGATPTITLPEFTATKPGAPPTAPTGLDEDFREAYGQALNVANNTITAASDTWFARYFPNHASQVAKLEARLDTYLAGGSAVDVNTASAIYEIERGKTDAEYRRVERSALLDAGKRGFVLPDGVAFAAQVNARTAAADANAGKAADIRKMLFDLEQKNLQFAVTESRTWRSVAVQTYQGMFTVFVTINGQSIEYAKDIVQAIIEVYNAQVMAYKTLLEGYQIEATVYGERLKAALAPLEVYKAQVQAEMAKARVNMYLTRAYETRIKVIETRVQVYRAQIEALVAKAGLERLKVELFDAKVRAFAAEVSAKEAEYRGFTAQVEGQRTLQEAWAEQVKARAVQLEAYRSQVTAITEQTRVLLSYNESITRQFEANTRAYEAAVRAEQVIIQSDVEQYRAQVEGIAQENNATAKVAELDLKKWEVGKELVLKQSELNLNRAKLEAEVKIENLKVQYQVANAIAEHSSRIAQAALSGISTLLAQTDTQSS
jgi:hypothetical protein